MVSPPITSIHDIDPKTLQACIDALAVHCPPEVITDPAYLASEPHRLAAAYNAGRASVVDQLRTIVARQEGGNT